MLTVEQLETLTNGIMEFNELAFTPEYKLSEEYQTHCKAMIEEEAKAERLEASNPIEELDSLCDTIVVCVQASLAPKATDQDKLLCYSLIGEAIMISHRKMYDLYNACRAVNANNLSKFPLLSDVMDMYGSEEGWKEAACDWIESQGRYKGVTCNVVENTHKEKVVVFKDNTGKVVKWAGYKDVDLRGYV